ncbi:MAG: hypothetical protein KGJ37_06745, partial [Verrucomicrobiota bacterium]|nr:hypothetical protein [Verrucomicrobiota bacterium]
MTLRRLLIISPHFPPINAPDAQRARIGLPYFRDFGWEPTVLAVAPQYVAGLREPRLLSALPSDVPIYRCGALPLRFGRTFGLGSLGPRAWFSMRAAGMRLLRREKFDLIFFSTTQFLICTLGTRWKNRFHVPFIIDLQDPWRTDYYERPGAPP